VLPGVGRILFGFLVTVLLACGVVYGMKRWLPRFSNRFVSNTRLSVQSTVQNGMRFHVVTVEGRNVLVAEGKSGIAMTVLPESKSPPTNP